MGFSRVKKSFTFLFKTNSINTLETRGDLFLSPLLVVGFFFWGGGREIPRGV